MRKSLSILFLISLSYFSGCTFSKNKSHFSNTDHQIKGTVVAIFDGDTYQLLTSHQQTIKVRMEGIDAPEREMPYHKVSQKYLSQLIYKKEIILIKTGEDQYRRSLGFTYLPDETDINLLMLQSGMAWHYKRYNQDIQYADAEQKAREERIGLWQDQHPTPPWSFRKSERKKQNSSLLK